MQVFKLQFYYWFSGIVALPSWLRHVTPSAVQEAGSDPNSRSDLFTLTMLRKWAPNRDGARSRNRWFSFFIPFLKAYPYKKLHFDAPWKPFCVFFLSSFVNFCSNKQKKRQCLQVSNLFQGFVGLSLPAVMASARLDYVAPWWTYWLHNFPHFNFLFQSVDSTFSPEEASYQQVGNSGRASKRTDLLDHRLLHAAVLIYSLYTV